MREPYYNEPGLEMERGTPQGDHNSKLYTEGVRVLTLQSIINVGRSPPGGMEAIVGEHLALRGQAIWTQAQAQQQGTRLIDCSGNVGGTLTAASAGCRSSIGRLLPRLQRLLGAPPAQE